MQYQHIFSLAKDNLKNFSNGAKEAQWILESFLGKDFLIEENKHKEIPSSLYKEIEEVLEKRKNHTPLSYLLGDAPFLEFSFKVCEGVLIPREDSIVLVEYLIQNAPRNSRVLEIGLGTGVLSLSLKKKRPDLFITGLDNNPKAIGCTKKNQQKLFGMQNAIEILESDFFEMKVEKPFDIVFSNPPYLSEEEWKNAQKELFFEPKSALVGGGDGLLFYKEMLKRIDELLIPKGLMVWEISPLRWAELSKILTKENFDFELLYDWNNQERALILKRKTLSILIV